MKNFLAFFVICFIVLSLPFCVADKSSDKAVAATIGAGGIVFIASNLGTVSKLFSAVADPTGAISSAVFSKIAEGVIASSPELAPVIQTYQKINKLKELGGEIGTDMQISDKGEIVGGSMSMDSQGPNQMGDMFGYENKDAVDVVNSDIEFGEDGKSAVVMGEGSVLKMDGIVEVSGTEDAAVEVQKISMNERGGCEDGSSPQGEDEKFCGSKLTSLDASFGKEGGDVVIGNTKIVAPPNSEVSFKEGDEFVSIMFKDGGKIESFPVANSASDDGISPVKYSGKFELPGGQEVDGDLIYNTENERMYLMKNEGIIDYDTTIDGVTVSSKYDENVEIFLDKDLITSDLKNFALIDDDVFLSNGVNAHLDDVNGNVIDVPNNPEAYYTITRNKDDSFSRILAYGETSEVNINNDVFERNGDNLLYHTTRTRDEKFVKASSVVGSGASSGSDISDINPSPKLEFEDLINEFTDKKESIKNEASRIQILRNQRVIYQTLDSGASAEIQAKDANRLLNIELDRISKESPSASSNVLKEDGDLDAYPEIVADYHKDGIAYYKNNPSRASMFYFLTN